MAKIRLPVKLGRQIRRKHGCKTSVSGAGTTDVLNIVTTILQATGSITQSRQRNIHDVTIDAANREA
jgi:hypothetical protein